jgi:hypothetical protein
MRLILICILLLVSESVFPQKAKWPIPFYFNEYGRYCQLDNKVNFNDTIFIRHSSKVYFKLVLFEERGKSYMEVYKNNKLYEKGYYENSIDTLKIYSRRFDGKRTNGTIHILKYFEPVKSGIWIETKNHKYVKREYLIGVDITGKR